jgi:hypothetical protein
VLGVIAAAVNGFAARSRTAALAGSILLDRDAGELDHLRPFAGLGRDKGGELAGRHGRWRAAQADSCCLSFASAKPALISLFELVDDPGGDIFRRAMPNHAVAS